MALSRRRLLAGTLATGALTSVGCTKIPAMSLTGSASKYQPTPELWSDNDISIAWIGHSTLLMNIHGTIVLTDPVLFEKIGVRILGSTLGPYRLTKPALFADDIPVPDLVLLSHAHMDHMDLASLEFLTERSPGKIHAITAKNTSDVIEDLEWASLREVDWGEQLMVGDMSIDALPVTHFGWRFPGEADRSKGQRKTGRSFNAYLITSKGKRIVFGGDTAYTEAFKDIASLGGIDVAAMPIGAYQPWISVHCTPEQALQMSTEMGAAMMLPMHCMTFRQGTEKFSDAPTRLIHHMPMFADVGVGYHNIGESFKL